VSPPSSGPKLSESFLGFNAVAPPVTTVVGPHDALAMPAAGADPRGAVSGGSSAPAATQPALPPPLLLDVTPHSLGLETLGGLCEVIIPRNATIPVEQTREFATAYDRQDAVRIRISQGESRRFVENQGLGELELSGITPAARGEVTIAVTFELDADGTLQVRAREVATGRQTATQVNLLTVPSASDEAGMTERQRG
jgi:molecular chaperone DnaK